MDKNIIILISSLIVLFGNVSFGKPNVKAAENDVREICGNTDDPTFCFNTINSDPRTGAANLTGLAEICIDLAGDAAKKAEALVATLIGAATDPELKDKYRACSQNFAGVTGDLGEASKGLNAGDRKAVSDSGLDGLNRAQDCRDEFEAPPKDPSDLSGLLGNLITLCGAVFFAAQGI